MATYESCSTSTFKHGRTETVRPATLETLSLSKAVSLPEEKRPNSAILRSALEKCSQMHVQLTKEAALGESHSPSFYSLGI